MTRETYLEYLKDQSKEVTPVMYFYYKLKGGTHNEYMFNQAFQKWIVFKRSALPKIYYKVFKELSEHFKILETL